jgi:multisubunit Na+/H+ antiporter MnhB subunit
VISVSAIGLGISMTFLVLKAPEVAITQLVVEILVLILLIRSTIHKDLPFSTSGRWFLNTSIMAVFIVMFLVAAYLALVDLPAFGHPIMRVAQVYLRDGFAQTGATNLVAAVVLNYRAYDRLGETTVLFTAFLAVLTVLRRAGRIAPGDSGKDEE